MTVQPATPPPAAAQPPPAAPPAAAPAVVAQPAAPTALAQPPVQTSALTPPAEAQKPTVIDGKWRPKAVEGRSRDEGAMSKAAEFFAKQGFNAEQSQALIDFSDELAKGSEAAGKKAAEEAAKAESEGWWKELQEHKELGGAKFEENRNTWLKGASGLLTPAELERVQKDGLANYPPLIAALYRAGAKISEDTLQDGNRAAPPVPSELEAMKKQYPKSPQLWDPNHPEFVGARK